MSPRTTAVLRLLRRAAVGAVVAYAAIALSLGGTRAARPVFHAALLAWVGVLLVCRRWPPPRFAAPAELVVTNVALTLLLGELALRGWAACSGQTLLWSAALDGHRLSPGHDYGAGLVGNRLGYPGPDVPPTKPPGTLRVLALGDSFAVGPAVHFEQNYLTHLQQQLPGVEVCNFGVSGAGPREYHVALQRHGWALQPDLVLVSVFVGNDITELLPAPRWLDPRGSAVYLLGERALQLAREQSRRPDSAARHDRIAAAALSEEAFREVEARRLRICISPPSPTVEKQWRRTLGHLGRLVAECRGRGVPVAAVLIPDEFQMNPAVLARALADCPAEFPALDLDLPQRRLAQFFDERTVPCLDLRPSLTADSYAPRDTHWNERGNRLAAGAIAAWLRPQLGRAAVTSR